nr:VOC family protein [Bacillus velezensis]
MMIKKIATVAVYTDDQQKAKTFWTEKAGFETVAEHPMGPGAFWLEVAPKGRHSFGYLSEIDDERPREHMKASIVFECEDVFAAYEQMKKNGITFLDEPKQMEWGSFVQFKDEDGHVFLLKS